MQNIFRFLGRSFSTEDFFTASLGLFLDRNEEFREAFLNWLQPHVSENLSEYSWTISVQESRSALAGSAVLDMVLSNPKLELWFEHKVGAVKGQYSTTDNDKIDQIQKYLTAACWHMSGKKPQEINDWPEKGEIKDRLRVLLFYITKNPERIDRSLYDGRFANRDRPYGLVCPKGRGHFQWQDFWPIAKRALETALSGERGEFEKTITKQFLSYWQSIPGMWIQDTHDIREWKELFKAPIDKDIPFAQYWSLMEMFVVDRLGWRRSRFEGPWIFFEPPENPSIDQVSVSASPSTDSRDGWDPKLGEHVLCVLLRFKPDIPAPPLDVMIDIEGRWTGRLMRHTPTRGKEQFRVLVGIPNWDNCGDNHSKKRAVAHTVIAGLRMIEKASKKEITFPGLEAIYDLPVDAA